MALYHIDIIDTLDDSHLLNVEYAERQSLRLKWEGADKKDELSIVSSTLEFSMEVSENENQDAKFIDLFNAGEERFQVRLITENGAVVWMGYLLPDSYNEPYRNGTFYVTFYAVCGLSLLKSKYLPEIYYQKEHSVLDILKELLKLTNANLNRQPIELFFAPAIVNVFESSYEKIYINGNNFNDDGDKQNAYDILSDLLNSMLCVCYQADSKWYVEGLNWRSSRLVEYVRDFPTPDPRVSKNYKELTALDEPQITVVPSYGEVVVNYEAENAELPDDLVKIEPLWREANPFLSKIHARHWKLTEVSQNDYMFHEFPDYNLVVRPLAGPLMNVGSSYSLFNPIYIKGGYVYEFVFEIKIKGVFVEGNDLSELKNALFFNITIDGRSILGNNPFATFGRDRVYFSVKEDYTASVTRSVFVPKDGLLDIIIFPTNDDLYYPNLFVEITDLQLKSVTDQDFNIVEELNPGISSLDKKIDLPYCANANAVGKVFQLDKIYDRNLSPGEFSFVDFVVQQLQIINTYHDDDNYFYVLTNEDAYLAYHYIENLYTESDARDSSLVANAAEVRFNYLNTEEHVLVADKSIEYTALYVRLLRIGDSAIIPRKNWLQWRDATAENEMFSYVKSASLVYGRMFSGAYINISATFEGAVQFNDIINFKYIQPSNYMVTNVTWNIDNGTSDVVMEAAQYGNSTGLNLSDTRPFVSVGGDKYVVLGSRDTLRVDAMGFSLGSDIVGYRWEVLQGDVTLPTIFSSSVVLTFGSALVNKLRVTVVDIFGNESFDEFYVYLSTVLRGQFSIDVDSLVDEVVDSGLSYRYVFFKQVFGLVQGQMMGDTIVMLSFNYALYYKRFETQNDDNFNAYNGFVSLKAYKNNVLVAEVLINRDLDLDKSKDFVRTYTGGINISYRQGDEVNVVLESNVTIPGNIFEGYVYLNEAIFLNEAQAFGATNMSIGDRGRFVVPTGIASYSDSLIESYESRFGNESNT